MKCAYLNCQGRRAEHYVKLDGKPWLFYCEKHARMVKELMGLRKERVSLCRVCHEREAIVVCDKCAKRNFENDEEFEEDET